MVHCMAGLSRYTAVGLALIVRGLVKEDRTQCGPSRWPNVLFTSCSQFGPRPDPTLFFSSFVWSTFLPAQQAHDLTFELMSHPALMENRFAKSKKARSPYQAGE